MTLPYAERSWWGKLLGRSVFKAIFGDFFEKKTNSASIIAITLVMSVCYVVVVKEKFEYMNLVLNIFFVVIGYYFGSKQSEVESDNEDK